MTGLSAPAARASATTAFSRAPQPSRTHTGTSRPPSAGGSTLKWGASLRGSLLAPWDSLVEPTTLWTASPRSAARSVAMRARSFVSRLLRFRNSASQSLLSRVCRLYSSSSLHQRAGVHQLVEVRRQAAAQRCAVTGQVLDQQIRQRPHVRPHADVGPGFARELANQEHQGADAGLELALGRAVFRAA